ncbi:MAG: immune inhibitor A domain-containing protein [Bacilli bacterium]
MKKKTVLASIVLIGLMSFASCSTLYFDNSYSSVFSFDESESIDESLNYSLKSSNEYYYSVNRNSIYSKNTPLSVGENKILVVPVAIKGYEKYATESYRNKIEKAFFGTQADTGWQSVKSYYELSSYNRLKITGTVTDWYHCELNPDEVYAKNNPTYGDGGTYTILDGAVNFAKSQGIDLDEYDTDDDGYIDAVWLIYSCPSLTKLEGVTNESNPFWAFTFWDYTKRNKGTKTNPVQNTYAWASFDFMISSTLPITIDAHTYIHEHGHILGLDDYYDTERIHSPLGGIDMMDLNIGDHCAFSKFSLGWVRPYVVNDECTINLTSFPLTGKFILVRTNESSYHDTAFDEYLLIEFLTPSNLWQQDSTVSYENGPKTFTISGVRITHIDARLYSNSLKTFVYSSANGGIKVSTSNTPSRSYNAGTSTLRTDLISIIPKNKNTSFQDTYNAVANNASLFVEGDSFDITSYSMFFENGLFHDGTSFPYTITVDKITSEYATISFTL